MLREWYQFDHSGQVDRDTRARVQSERLNAPISATEVKQMKTNRQVHATRFYVTLAALSVAAAAQASPSIAISDGSELSMELTAKSCRVTHKNAKNARWIGVRAQGRDASGAATGERFEFRLGEAQTRPVEVLEIVTASESTYRPVALLDVLQAELTANKGSWSAEKIAEQRGMIDDADGQPNHELRDIAITIDGMAADTWFEKLRSEKRFSSSRVAPVTVVASGLNVARGEDFVKAKIDLKGECTVALMTE